MTTLTITHPFSSLLTGRRLAATAASGLLAMSAIAVWRYAPLALRDFSWLPVITLTAATCLLWRPNFTAQLLTRAIWMSSLVMGLILSAGSSEAYIPLGANFALGAFVALLFAGTLDGMYETAAVSATRYRAGLSVAVIAAAADAHTLIMFAGHATWHETVPHPTLYFQTVVHSEGVYRSLLCGAVMLILVIGLLRLKVWAFVGNVMMNLVVAWLALDGWLQPELIIKIALCSTAALQLLLALPVLAAVFVGGKAIPKLDDRSIWAIAALLVTVVGVGVVAVGSYL